MPFLLQYSKETYVICRKDFGVETDKVSLGAKGSVKINRVSDQFGEEYMLRQGTWYIPAVAVYTLIKNMFCQKQKHRNR